MDNWEQLLVMACSGEIKRALVAPVYSRMGEKHWDWSVGCIASVKEHIGSNAI